MKLRSAGRRAEKVVDAYQQPRGGDERAEQLRIAALEQLTTTGGFAEYYEPFTGEPIGSLAQSWSAAVALDWLAGYDENER